MPTNVTVIRAGDFVRAKPGGVLDLAASVQLLADVVAASRAVDDMAVLLDTRNALAVLSTTDLWSLAEKAAASPARRFRRTAVLCPAERFDHARFFAMCGERHNFDVRAFTDYERAMEWLISDHPSAS